MEYYDRRDAITDAIIDNVSSIIYILGDYAMFKSMDSVIITKLTSHDTLADRIYHTVLRRPSCAIYIHNSSSDANGDATGVMSGDTTRKNRNLGYIFDSTMRNYFAQLKSIFEDTRYNIEFGNTIGQSNVDCKVDCADEPPNLKYSTGSKDKVIEFIVGCYFQQKSSSSTSIELDVNCTINLGSRATASVCFLTCCHKWQRSAREMLDLLM
mgnify:CR=1 FL=1|tara:strand:+ start:6725 stop:7357 length:633 start_codon:yes stop_codon:yes gene_type:complete